MPLTKTNTQNAIRSRVNPTAKQREDCIAVIAKLNFADLGRGSGRLYTQGDARLDMQGQVAAGANLQVQIGEETAAAAIIAPTVQATTDPMNQKGASNGAIAVLNASLDS